ncbi:MAG TPA: hypothetical protein DE060_02685 [Lentisphaeria bacterium]|nr:hypothetical protein [Lentisphaeria bacterium]HCG48097.1 hypothetical protein [Lentisphaeria bacterium]
MFPVFKRKTEKIYGFFLKIQLAFLRVCRIVTVRKQANELRIKNTSGLQSLKVHSKLEQIMFPCFRFFHLIPPDFYLT